MVVRLKSDSVSQHAADLGRMGGKATLKKYGKNHFSEIGKRGVKSKKK